MENRKQTANFAEKQYTMADTDEYSKGEIVLYQPDETVKLEVRLDNETVWLTQQQAKFAHKGSDGDLYKECGKSKRSFGNISC